MAKIRNRNAALLFFRITKNSMNRIMLTGKQIIAVIKTAIIINQLDA